MDVLSLNNVAAIIFGREGIEQAVLTTIYVARSISCKNKGSKCNLQKNRLYDFRKSKKACNVRKPYLEFLRAN